jgi:hypothetical protein
MSMCFLAASVDAYVYWDCDDNPCTSKPLGCCGSQCCYDSHCCDDGGNCIACDKNGLYCEDTYCGTGNNATSFSCCGSTCCPAEQQCCDSAGNCIECAFVSKDDDFTAITDDQAASWVCGSTNNINCPTAYGRTDQPNGCCLESCCYGDAFCCNSIGDCVPCVTNDDSTPASSVNTTAVIAAVVGAFVFTMCSLWMVMSGRCNRLVGINYMSVQPIEAEPAVFIEFELTVPAAENSSVHRGEGPERVASPTSSSLSSLSEHRREERLADARLSVEMVVATTAAVVQSSRADSATDASSLLEATSIPVAIALPSSR